MNNTKEVYFDKYCKTCENSGKKESEDPCYDCLTEGSNENSHKPVGYKEKTLAK